MGTVQVGRGKPNSLCNASGVHHCGRRSRQAALGTSGISWCVGAHVAQLITRHRSLDGIGGLLAEGAVHRPDFLAQYRLLSDIHLQDLHDPSE
jgi:hypothetical protein